MSNATSSSITAAIRKAIRTKITDHVENFGSNGSGLLQKWKDFTARPYLRKRLQSLRNESLQASYDETRGKVLLHLGLLEGINDLSYEVDIESIMSDNALAEIFQSARVYFLSILREHILFTE